jgi:hypothetical protein
MGLRAVFRDLGQSDRLWAAEIIGVSHENQAGRPVRRGISWSELQQIISEGKTSEAISGVANIEDNPLLD